MVFSSENLLGLLDNLYQKLYFASCEGSDGSVFLRHVNFSSSKSIMDEANGCGPEAILVFY